MNKQKPRKLNLTIRSIEAMPVPETGRSVLHDRHTRGLSAVRLPSGNFNFIWFRKAGSKARWVTLGEYPALSIEDARLAAAELNTRLAHWKRDGMHGDFLAERGSPTLQTVFDKYVIEQLQHAKNPARARELRTEQFNTYLSDLAGKRLAQITKADVRAFHAGIAAPVVANRCVELLRALINFAERNELFPGPNPARGIRLNREISRDRFLTAAELKRLFDAMDETVEYDRDACDYIALSLFCGSRKSDTISMAWQDLDLDGKVWRVPTPKTSKPYLIPLSRQACEIIVRRRGEVARKSAWVFPDPRDPEKHKGGYRISWERISKRAELENITLHDCRRTFATLQASLPGSSLILIGSSLGHANTNATQIYARAQLSAVRESVQAAADQITSIITKK